MYPTHQPQAQSQPSSSCSSVEEVMCYQRISRLTTLRCICLSKSHLVDVAYLTRSLIALLSSNTSLVAKLSKNGTKIMNFREKNS